jgi:transposase
MAEKRAYKLVEYLRRDELDGLLKDCSDPVLAQRLLFVSHLYDGDSVSVAGSKVRMVKNSAYIWAYRWNEKGVDGLLTLPKSGRPSKLSGEQKEELKELLSMRDDWTTREVRELILEDFDVEITMNGVYRMLRSWGMNLGKPYPKDCRRPEDAEEILKKSVEDAVEKLEADGVISDQLIVGFLDQASSQTKTNPRLWSFRKPVLVKNMNVSRVNIYGFYTTNGNSVVDFKEDGKTDNVCQFLETIREENPYKKILVILDNYRPHTTDKTLEKAAELGMILVNLPPYCPDLNPIEQLWRVLKRILSLLFNLTTDEVKRTIREIYRVLSVRTSFAEKWIDTYIE